MTQHNNAPVPAPSKELRNSLFGAGFGDDLPPGKEMHYAIGRDGLYLVRDSEIGNLALKLGSTSIPIPAAPPMTEGWDPYLPQIPFPLFAQAISFLKDVKATMKTEGLVRFYYDPTQKTHNGWVIHVPEQTVGPAEVQVAEGLAQPPGLFAAEIHSHPGMSANPSSVDDANERVTRMYMIVAFPNHSAPVFTSRIGTGFAAWVKVPLDEFVDIDTALTKKLAGKLSARQILGLGGGDPFPYVPYPSEWLDQVKKPIPIVYQPVVSRERYYPRLAELGLDDLNSDHDAELAKFFQDQKRFGTLMQTDDWSFD